MGKRKAHLLRELDIQDGNGLQLGYVPRRAATTASRALTSPTKQQECGALAVGSARNAPASQRSAAAAAVGPPLRASVGKVVSAAKPVQVNHRAIARNEGSTEAIAACGSSLTAAGTQAPNFTLENAHNPVPDPVTSLKVLLPSPVGRRSRHRPALPAREPPSSDPAAAATSTAPAVTASPTDHAVSGIAEQDKPLSVVDEDSAAPAAYQLRAGSSKSVPRASGRRVYPRGRLRDNHVEPQPAGEQPDPCYPCLRDQSS